LRLHVLSVQSQNHFPITCPGNDYQCRELITIPIIQSLLSPTEFEDLLEQVAESHIVRHRNQYKYCVTANCMQMYCYTDENPRLLTCPSCSISFCSVCRTKPHGKEPCALLTLDDKSWCMGLWSYASWRSGSFRSMVHSFDTVAYSLKTIIISCQFRGDVYVEFRRGLIWNSEGSYLAGWTLAIFNTQ